MNIQSWFLDHSAWMEVGLPLPLEPLHGWRSSPDEGGHTHCRSCGYTILRGDPVVGYYLEYISVVFCPECVADNPEMFDELMKPRPELVPKFRVGDRVVMLEHDRWTRDCRGTIVRDGEFWIFYDSSIHVQYKIGFDEPQTVLVGGDRKITRECKEVVVFERYLRSQD